EIGHDESSLAHDPSHCGVGDGLSGRLGCSASILRDPRQGFDGSGLARLDPVQLVDQLPDLTFDLVAAVAPAEHHEKLHRAHPEYPARAEMRLDILEAGQQFNCASVVEEQRPFGTVDELRHGDPRTRTGSSLFALSISRPILSYDAAAHDPTGANL